MTSNVLAVILRQEEWREHDVLVTMYTRERGKVEAVAKGLRKMESKLASHLEPLNTAEIFIVQGRRWPIIAGSIVENARLSLSSDLKRLAVAGAIARLADLMTPLESHDERIFRLLDETLTLVNETALEQDTFELLVHFFAWKMLIFSGYRPELKHCLRCRRSSAIAGVVLDPRRGGTVHSSCLENARGIATLPLNVAALKGLSYMAEAPISHTLRLKSTKESFGAMMSAIEAQIKERFEQSSDLAFGVYDKRLF
jgi:DNA repair protein RecO (recombination protein O)